MTDLKERLRSDKTNGNAAPTCRVVGAGAELSACSVRTVWYREAREDVTEMLNKIEFSFLNGNLMVSGDPVLIF
jgi:hypothetical protein